MRLFLGFIICLFLATACRDKIICSAFQSTYILDDSTRHAYYSSFWRLDKATQEKYLASIAPPDTSSDSSAVGNTEGMAPYYAYVEKHLTPIVNPRRTRYGVVKYEPNWMKTYKLKSSPMENVLGPRKEAPDIEEEQVDLGEFVATDLSDTAVVIDSMMLASEDSLLVAPKDTAVSPKREGPKYLYGYDPKDNFNVEQEYYNKYFGEYLIAKPKKEPEVPEAASDSTQVSPEPVVSDSTQTEEGRGGLFRRRNQNQETQTEEPIEELQEEGQQEEGGQGK